MAQQQQQYAPQQQQQQYAPQQQQQQQQFAPQQGGPAPQQMAPGPEWLGACEAILIRQKLQLFEQFCTLCEKSNKYAIYATSAAEANQQPPLNDQEIFRQPARGYIAEKSGFLCRICCHNKRELELGMWADEQRAIGGTQAEHITQVDFMKVTRPFKLGLPCYCCMICPQEAHFTDPNGQKFGSAMQEWNCSRMIEAGCKGRCVTRVMGAQGETKYHIKTIFPTCCNGCQNLCAPTCCNKTMENEITDAADNVVGNYKDNYPGMIGWRCCSDASNFSLTFPVGISPIDKATLLGALMLNEFMWHEKSGEQAGGV